MANTAIITAHQPLTFLNFQEEPVQTMDLATLKRTQKEHIGGVPLREIYHFDAIERALGLCSKYGLDYHIEEIFAAHNKNKQFPGTSLLEQAEAQYGKNAVEAHILRRVFTTIRIDNFETEELTTTLALAYHQDGIQAAIGPCVKVCHNQCVMFAERRAFTYGKEKKSVDGLFETIDDWLANFQNQMSADRARIEMLKNTRFTHEQVITFIGVLASIRVAHDSRDKSLRDVVETYPLNNTQVNTVTEELLKMMQTKPFLTGWEVYNAMTLRYKPEEAEIPTLIPQNFAAVETLVDFIEGKKTVIEVEAEVVN